MSNLTDLDVTSLSINSTSVTSTAGQLNLLTMETPQLLVADGAITIA